MAVRNWSDTELLPSAAFDEVMTSGHMIFANAAARDAMLVDDIAPVAGMRAFMLDTNLLLTYVVVGAAGYWAPQAGTLLFNHYQPAVQALPNPTQGLAVTITNLSPLAGARNFGSWLNTTTGRFLPLCPGYYEFFGTTSQTGANATQFYRSGFRSDFNIYYPMPIPSSENRWFSPPSVMGAMSLGGVTPCRKYQQYMNGTTDWMELCLVQLGIENTIVTAGYQCQFGAKYLGM